MPMDIMELNQDSRNPFGVGMPGFKQSPTFKSSGIDHEENVWNASLQESGRENIELGSFHINHTNLTFKHPN